MALPVPPCPDVARIYASSPLHLAIFNKDYAALRLILLPVPKPAPSGSILTEQQSLEAEKRAVVASSILDYRDVPGKESPLGLAVRLGDPVAVEMLMRAGADVSLQNAAGWTPLQEAICARDEGLTAIILRHYQVLAWGTYMRRLPALAAIMQRMQDFYMELTWNFESSVIPFISRIAPSDTYHIWKRGSSLRADMTLAGFDGLRIKRKNQSLMFFGDGTTDGKVKPGTLVVLNHEKLEIFDALEGAGGEPTEAELAQDVQSFFQTNVYRAGIDVTAAKLLPQTSWRGGAKTDVVSGYKTKVYEMHNVAFKFKSRKVLGESADVEVLGEEGAKAGKGKRKSRGGKDEAGKGASGSRLSEPNTPTKDKSPRRGGRGKESGEDTEDDEDDALGLDDVLTEEERQQLDAVLAGGNETDDDAERGSANGECGGSPADVRAAVQKLTVEDEGASGEGNSGSGAEETKRKGKGRRTWSRWRRQSRGGEQDETEESVSGEGPSPGHRRFGSRSSNVGPVHSGSKGKAGESADEAQLNGGEESKGQIGSRGQDSRKKQGEKESERERENSGSPGGVAEDKEKKEMEKEEGWGGYEKKEDNEMRKGLRPVLWLTEDFPLDMQELLPLLDLLANKVKAVRRVKELLTTKLPPGHVPVKVAIPIIPTIRVSVTFSKFEAHHAPKPETGNDGSDDEFHTPPGSPEAENGTKSGWFGWARRRHKRSDSSAFDDGDVEVEESEEEVSNHWTKDPFQIPEEYSWVTLAERKKRDRERRKKAKAKARAKKETTKGQASTSSA